MEAYREELLEPVCHAVVDRFEGDRHVDLRAVLTHLLPMEVITRLLGLPSEDSESLERWSNALFTYPFDPEGALAAKARVHHVPRAGHGRSAAPTPVADLVSTLVHGEFQGRTLDRRGDPVVPPPAVPRRYPQHHQRDREPVLRAARTTPS